MPDLTFIFLWRAFIHPDKAVNKISKNLERALSPDGGLDRAFPFLFIEVKRGDQNLQKAQLNNLNNAAQTLHNIYQWFKRAEELDANIENKYWMLSFQDIRIFTFSFNAVHCVVRMHRAQIYKSGKVGFRFAEFFSKQLYNRDELCNLFNAILNEYASQELFNLLTEVFQAVVKLDASSEELLGSGLREDLQSFFNADTGSSEDSESTARADINDNDHNQHGGSNKFVTSGSTGEEYNLSQNVRQSPDSFEESPAKRPRRNR